MGIHVFKVCSCILDQTNQEAIQNAESVSMGARLAQQCLPAPERHCVVLVGNKTVEKVKGRGAARCRELPCCAGAALLQGSPALCCLCAFSPKNSLPQRADSTVLIPAQLPELRAEIVRKVPQL